MPLDFDPSYQAPNWAWWIVLYFFIGGLAGGAYFAAAWLDLFGDQYDRAAMRRGHRLAFPLLILGALCLILDLGQPLRFWHMLFQSERFPLPIIKPYSPMSLGSLILSVFGGASFLSFVDALIGRGRWFHSSNNLIGKVLSAVGGIAGLGLAGYTGMLLNVSNEPVWANSPWISALFLFSGLSTGIALLLLFARRAPHTTFEKLSEADGYMMLFELVTLVLFLGTLGALGPRFVYASPTLLLFVVVLIGGLVVPLALHWRPRLAGGMRSAATLSAVLVLISGFVLRWAVLAAPQGIGL